MSTPFPQGPSFTRRKTETLFPREPCAFVPNLPGTFTYSLVRRRSVRDTTSFSVVFSRGDEGGSPGQADEMSPNAGPTRSPAPLGVWRQDGTPDASPVACPPFPAYLPGLLSLSGSCGMSDIPRSEIQPLFPFILYPAHEMSLLLFLLFLSLLGVDAAAGSLCCAC